MTFLLFHLRETPLDTARRELTEHRAACDACIAGLDCPTGDDLDRRLTEAASGDLPWPDTSFQIGNNSETPMLTLPAVSLTAPWCYLCVAGIKTIETRKGALLSGFTGPLVICRTKAPPVDYDLSQFGVTLPTLPYTDDDRGMAVGIVFVRGTIKHTKGQPLFPCDLPRLACYHDLDGRYLSELAHAAWFPRPVKAKGQQTRFKVDVPAEFVPAWAKVS